MALVTLRQLLDHAAEHDYGVPAFNINNMEQGLAVLEAASSVDAPVIIQASRGARSYANDVMLAKMIEALVIMYPAIPIVMHQDHGGSAAVKHFGRKMTIDHAKSTRLVKAAVRASHMPPPPPPMLDDDQKAMIADLQGKHGKAFDDAYIPDQMKAHQAALALVTAEANSGEDPHLKAAAAKIVPVVKSHIAMLQKMGG